MTFLLNFPSEISELLDLIVQMSMSLLMRKFSGLVVNMDECKNSLNLVFKKLITSHVQILSALL
jgi:hypothetical protein